MTSKKQFFGHNREMGLCAHMCRSNRQNDVFKLMILDVGMQNLGLSQAINENIN